MALVQCAPNFSEGRREEVIAALMAAILAVDGVRLLAVAPDATDNRTVITFAGAPSAIANAAVRAAEAAARLIDLSHHQGDHPRIGATDVIPFVPISGCSVQDCAAIAREVGAAIGTRLGIPVYLYEAAATRPERRELASVRSALAGFWRAPPDARERPPLAGAYLPDFGPASLHPSAGATAVGARLPFIVWHAALGDRTAAGEVAAALAGPAPADGATGPLSGVQVLGVSAGGELSLRVQFSVTPLHAVFRRVQQEAERRGTSVSGGELSGLVPVEALLDVARHFLRLHGLSPEQVLEKQLLEG